VCVCVCVCVDYVQHTKSLHSTQLYPFPLPTFIHSWNLRIWSQLYSLHNRSTLLRSSDLVHFQLLFPHFCMYQSLANNFHSYM